LGCFGTPARFLRPEAEAQAGCAGKGVHSPLVCLSPNLRPDSIESMKQPSGSIAVETQACSETIEGSLESPETAPRWSLAARVVFRFCVLYFGSYILVTQLLASIFLVPNVDVPELGALSPVRPAVLWVAKHLFSVSEELVITGSGSGDKIFDWTEV